MELNVLILHNLGDPATWRESMVEKELCLPRFAKGHNYLVHDFLLPLPPYVKDMHFDGIVLTQTFLSKRRDPLTYARARSEYGFVGDSSAFKIALPQDDYTCNAVLDRWMVEWSVDLVYPVCTDGWDLLYPTYRRRGRLLQGYTGYISDGLIERTRRPKPLTYRATDVSYRAAKLSPEYGRMGLIKTEIGKRFQARAAGRGLRLDLSTDPKDAILGTRWYDFIEDSRCMLGVNSGASMLDPEGRINLAVHRHLQRNPSASFEEVEAACFPGLDGNRMFTAISPRNLECGLLGTVQLLTPGPYGNFLKPGEHYIPLQPDMSNIDDVITWVKDASYLAKIAGACREELLSRPELRYQPHAEELMTEIGGGTRLADRDRSSSRPYFRRYSAEMQAVEGAFWRKRRLKNRLRESLVNLGARKAKYFILDMVGGGKGR